jgi:cobalt-zinc-cadmium efflux system membrane fusion protein
MIFINRIPTVRRTLLWIIVLCAISSPRVFAHGGVDDEKPEPAAVGAAASGATETDLELHLEDLTQGATGTSAPLIGAKVRGFLKHDDGDLLSRITVKEEKTPGFYVVRFAEGAATYRFSEPGNYLLELNIQPLKGDAINTTVNFTLPAATLPTPLWRRFVPLVLGVLALLAAVLVWRAMRRKRQPPSNAPTVAALILLALGSAALSTQRASAHGGVDDEKPEPTVASVAAAPNIRLGQTTATTTAGNLRITLIARTKTAVPETLAPGEVQLPAQTAQLLQIKTQPVQVAQLATGIDFNGQIAPDPNSIVRVASIVPGRVTKLLVSQGDNVQQGQTVAVIESRAVGEAQSGYQQALARFNNAQSNLNVVQKQASAGVFSRGPVDAVRQNQAQAAGDLRQAQAGVAQARAAYENAVRTARVGGYASPALEAARRQSAEATEAARAAEAALDNAKSSVESAQAELDRRKQLATSGAYVARPVEEARRALVAAQSARAAAQSEVATTRANLNRAKSLNAEGLVSGRDLETAQQAFETATARLSTSQTDEATAQQELERQQKIAGGNVNGIAEVQQAQSALAAAQADVKTRSAEVQRAKSGVDLAAQQLAREQKIYSGNIANRREVGSARANLQAAQAGVYKAQRTLEVANAQLAREQKIFRENLNNISNVQSARAGYVQAQADLRAARSTLSLLKSSPGGSVSVPIRAPISGTIQTREAALGELIQADAPLMTIVNLKTVALEAQLFEADIARVRYGSPVTVSTQAAPGRKFSGKISFIGSEVDPQTRTVTARALIANPGVLRPGVFATGQIQTGVGKLSIVVPESAVIEDGAAKVVFVSKGDKYERREVTVGNESNNRLEVKSGLKQGEIVVTEGAAALRAQAAKGV